VAAVEGDEPLPLHFGKLVAQGASIHAEIVCQLLAVEGDGEIPAAPRCCLVGEVGEEAAADGLGAGVEDAAGKLEILGRGNEKEVSHKGGVEAAGVFAGVQYPCRAQKEDLAVLRRHGADHQLRPGHAGVSLGKDLAPLRAAQNALVAPRVVIFDGDAAAEHQPQTLRYIPRHEDGGATGELFHLRAEAGEHGFDLKRRCAAEKRRFFQKNIVHNLTFVVLTTYLSVSL